MNTLILLAIVLVNANLFTIAINAYGQTVDNQTFADCDLNAPSMPAHCINDSNAVMIYSPNDTNWNKQQLELFQSVLTYCYLHADRPNPIQDLVDKGFLPLVYEGQTCISVRDMYNTVETKVKQIERIENEFKQCMEQREVFYDKNEALAECKLSQDKEISQIK